MLRMVCQRHLQLSSSSMRSQTGRIDSDLAGVFLAQLLVPLRLVALSQQGMLTIRSKRQSTESRQMISNGVVLS